MNYGFYNTQQDLLRAIKLGEDDTLELKEVRVKTGKVVAPTQKNLADEIAAFANARGGTLVLGVQDKTRKILGVPLEYLDHLEKIIHQACEDSLDPSCMPSIRRFYLGEMDEEQKPVMSVQISPSLFVHQSPGGFFYRVGSSKRQMSTEFVSRLYQQRAQGRLIRFDETPVFEASLKDLEETLWQRFLTHRSMDTHQNMLMKIDMAHQENSKT